MDSDARPPKWPSTLNWPWSPTKHDDDSTHSDPERFVNVPVVITEKLDGGNTGLFRGDVYARSVMSPSRDGWMGMVRKHHAWKTHALDPNLVFNGEDLFGIHSIEYDPLREDQTFYLFGVRHVDTPAVIRRWASIERHAAELNVPTVPVLFQGVFGSVNEITKWFETHLREPSSIGGKDREGFVIRIAELCTDWAHDACKFIRPKHIQTDEHWRVNWQPCKLKESE